VQFGATAFGKGSSCELLLFVEPFAIGEKLNPRTNKLLKGLADVGKLPGHSTYIFGNDGADGKYAGSLSVFPLKKFDLEVEIDAIHFYTFRHHVYATLIGFRSEVGLRKALGTCKIEPSSRCIKLSPSRELWTSFGESNYTLSVVDVRFGGFKRRACERVQRT
jgi:hypothetical protein